MHSGFSLSLSFSESQRTRSLCNAYWLSVYMWACCAKSPRLCKIGRFFSVSLSIGAQEIDAQKTISFLMQAYFSVECFSMNLSQFIEMSVWKMSCRCLTRSNAGQSGVFFIKSVKAKWLFRCEHLITLQMVWSLSHKHVLQRCRWKSDWCLHKSQLGNVSKTDFTAIHNKWFAALEPKIAISSVRK